MNRFIASLIAVLVSASAAILGAAETALPSIERVEIGARREFRVNGQPFFPLLAWLQDADNFAAVKECAMNTTAGYWSGSSGTKGVGQYLALVEQAGLYGVLPYAAELRGHGHLLGYIHDDEPDLPQQVSDAEVLPGPGLVINRQTPLWKVVDGVTHTWSVLDPLEGAQLTIRLKQPVTVHSLAVWLTVSKGLPLAKEITFAADGREILQATLQPEKGQQKWPLAQPATFRELQLTVRSIYPGDHAWGSVGEIEGFDAQGKNVLLAPPRHEPRALPAATLAKYREIQAADPSRPVFMTFTGNFHPHFAKWSDDQRQRLYPAYIEAADVVGYDIYPIYGWNRPDWIHLVQEATDLLVRQAGPRPVYAWIETSKGGQWTGPLERQKDVTPAHIRAEVWMSICRGATAIGYFTHVWQPAYRQFGVPEENRRALREINQQITRLAPAILDQASQPAVTVRAGDDTRVDVTARQHEGALYVFAVNYDPRLQKTQATMVVDGLAAGREVTVIDEGRMLSSTAGAFTDVFEPLAVHLYRIAAPE